MDSLILPIVPPSGAWPPIAIGGVGGSGTRLVAQFLLNLGFFLGADLNESNDNLWFTLLFKRREILLVRDEEIADLVAVFLESMNGSGSLSASQLELVRGLASANRLAHDAEWLRQRAQSLENWTARQGRAPVPWGWKEPNTHVVLNRLAPLLPGMKYVHVIRNGLDMAYSSNQTQLQVWGPAFLGLEKVDTSPRLSLKYWRAVHLRVLAHGRRLGDRFLLLNFDRLCASPEESLCILLQFLGAEPDRVTRDLLLASIRPPQSVGRFRRHPPSDFDPDDVAFARHMGFDTDYGNP
jgi:hypothetical protein